MTSDDRYLPGLHPIDAYGNGGFRFAGMSHRGSLLCLPSGMRAWTVARFEDISEESFARVLAEAGAIGHLLIGTGPELRPLPKALRLRLTEAGIRPEVMATGAAARTYSILIGENRPVSAALIAVD